MSFQFPANPADGDIVVRGNLLATYTQDTNTWTVGEIPTYPGVPGPNGPQGIQGIQGDPGSGVNVTAIVDSYDELPLDPETGAFVVVADTNTLYYWDGTKYFDLGSPIQGPKGEQGGTGDTGQPGLNGIDGRGWFGTSIDRDNGEYKIVFQSNDGLEFTTDDLKGGSWEPVYATADTPGLVKLGRGLDLTDEGELETRDTYVQIETVPLGGDDNTSFSLSFSPAYLNWADNKSSAATSYSSGGTSTQGGALRVPANSNGALFYYFTGSTCNPYFSAPGGYGLNWTVFSKIVAQISISGAVFENGGQTIGIPMTHNFAIGSEARRTSEIPVTKIGQIIYPIGTTSITVTQRVTCNEIQRAQVGFGRGRVIIIPYLDEDGQLQTDNGMRTSAFSMFSARSLFSEDLTNSEPYTPELPPTAEEITLQQGQQLREALQFTLNAIDVATVQTHTSGSVYDELMLVRAELANLVNLPGTVEQIFDEYERLAAQVDPYISFNFRFEV